MGSFDNKETNQKIGSIQTKSYNWRFLGAWRPKIDLNSILFSPFYKAQLLTIDIKPSVHILLWCPKIKKTFSFYVLQEKAAH